MSTFGWIAAGIMAAGYALFIVALFAGAAKHRRNGGS